MSITQSELKSLVVYEPETGVFRWAVGRPGCRKGARCGRLSKSHGYVDICLRGILYRAHRLAFLYVTGRQPNGDIDHKNGDKSDNRWKNLRECSRSQNMANRRRMNANNTSGVRGVTFDKQRGKWRAQGWVNGVKKNLGRYNTQAEAKAAFDRAMAEQHGEFYNGQ